MCRSKSGSQALRVRAIAASNSKILRVAFAEADPRINDDLRFLRRPHDARSLLLCPDRLVHRELRLWRMGLSAWCAAGHACASGLAEVFRRRRYIRDAWIALQRGNVIEDFRACSGCCLGYFRLAGIHRNWNLDFAAKFFEHRKDTLKLFFRRKWHANRGAWIRHRCRRYRRRRVPFLTHPRRQHRRRGTDRRRKNCRASH